MISVILPTYNRCDLLPRAIESVLAQTGCQLELIVVDDASTDDTPQLMAEYTDPRVRYLRQANNQGACAARNAGIAAARGEYIAFQDSDDLWHADKLQKQLAFMEETGADIVFCAFCRHSDKAEEGTQVTPPLERGVSQATYGELLCGNLISTQTILGKKQCFVDHPFDPTFPRMQDWELVLRHAQIYRIMFQPQVLADVYLQADSISRKPKAGLAAYEKLHQLHRSALRRTDDAARKFAVGTAIFAFQCGQNPWKSYLKFLSPHLKLSTNLFLLRHSLQALVLKR